MPAPWALATLPHNALNLENSLKIYRTLRPKKRFQSEITIKLIKFNRFNLK